METFDLRSKKTGKNEPHPEVPQDIRPRQRPMPPLNRPSVRHTDRNGNSAPASSAPAASNDELFLEPMMGTPLAIYIEKDVPDKDQLVQLITKHGGSVSPGYSGVPYILVDPHTESGQSLYRQYAGKKGKIVLGSRWIYECIRKGELQTYHTNWAGCKVTGTEQVTASAGPSTGANLSNPTPIAPRRGRPPGRSQTQQPQPQPQALPQAASHATGYVHQPMHPAPASIMSPAAPLGAPNFPYPVYSGQNTQHHVGRPVMPPPTAAPQTWQTPTPITPHQHTTHIQMLPARTQNPYGRDEHWNDAGAGFPHMAAPTDPHSITAMNDNDASAYYDQRYREGQSAWPENSQDYYEPQQTYSQHFQHHAEPYVPVAGPSNAGPSNATVEPTPVALPSPREERGRKRGRAPAQPAPPASTLVLNRRHPPARSPTPPTRIIRSTYGGNLFTSDDVLYLKKYIDYCQEQGLVLSLREICERIAVKAPHHTFYSWRRYCNKHQIRLGGYAMDVESRSPSPGHQENGQFTEEAEVFSAAPVVGEGPFTIAAAQRVIQEQGMRNRSPTPPRALFRSTTGKGVAFTVDDVSFLCKFMAYRKAQGRLDMVTFWKDVASKAPHHSRASWMKYYRRHKHELNRVEGDDPLPAPPPKKMRYGRNDDILLAQYFAGKPEGTSDKIFQDFAKIYPHHPWKGWQEHHRIHKAKIDHLIQRINIGETLEMGDDDE